MAYRATKQDLQNTSEMAPIVYLWILRVLISIDGLTRFIDVPRREEYDVLKRLGISEEVNKYSERNLLKKIHVKLTALHKTAERDNKAKKFIAPDVLRRNIARFSELIYLTDTDRRIFEFAILLNNEDELMQVVEHLGGMKRSKFYRTLSILLDTPEEKLRASLSPQGPLIKTGLLSISHENSFEETLVLLSDNFAHSICSSDTDPISLLSDTARISSPGLLTTTDYEHIEYQLKLLLYYLKRTISTKRKGVNILIHGAPGTGKSQLAKTLAKEINCELFEIASETRDDFPIDGESRLRAYRAAQSIFTQHHVLIVFDEAEDVFNEHYMGMKSVALSHKAWINKALEESVAPTIWLTNSIRNIDPAFIRRFDMVFELPVPPKKQREQIILSACNDLLDAPMAAHLAEAEKLAPAVITRAASVVRAISDDLCHIDKEKAVELLIRNTLKAQGHSLMQMKVTNTQPDYYDPQIIHADSDLERIAAGLTQAKSGRLCLYGPPGTGKTAYGRWLATQMGVGLVVKRASDLMSMWVGENEKNIANAFQEASNEGALLLIDEVDSFLQDRRGAHRGWEVSLVNEMLTQMESFDGVFIASTNLMEGLDKASLRRFDLKVKFDYLRTEQAWKLLCHHCNSISVEAPDDKLKQSIKKLNNLTPGDFAAVMRQHRFHPITSAATFIIALEAECAIKQETKPTIGFLGALLD